MLSYTLKAERDTQLRTEGRKEAQLHTEGRISDSFSVILKYYTVMPNVGTFITWVLNSGP